MRQRLGLAQTLIGNPSLLLLDEPSNGLDPNGQQDILKCIRELHKLGKTIVMSSHRLQEVTEVCTDLVILNQGRIIYQNNVPNALSLKQRATIQLDQSPEALYPLLQELHPDISIEGNTVILKNDAMSLRRQILVILIQNGLDIVSISTEKMSLADIYAEVVQ